MKTTDGPAVAGTRRLSRHEGQPRGLRGLPLAEMIRYGLVGVVNTAVGLAVILLGMNVVGLHYALANALGYGLGLIVSYLLNRRFTFRSSRRIVSGEPLLFLFVFGISYAVQMGLLILCVELLRMNRSLAQILAMGVYTACGYLGNKFITFSGPKSSSPADAQNGPAASC
jgi:putative flippase GtrA